jgi:hypothetical protein
LLNDDVQRDLIKGLDVVSSTMIAVCWCYLVPYAAYPDGGCPSDDAKPCWRYAGYLFLWIFSATLVLPLVSVRLQKRLTRLAQNFDQKGSTFRKNYIVRSQRLFIGSLGTVWSIANSSFITAIVKQGALTGLAGFKQAGQESGDNYDDIASSVINPFALDQSDRSANARAILFSSGFCLAYFSAATLTIVGVSGACEITVWFGISPGDYWVELALLLQNNW